MLKKLIVLLLITIPCLSWSGEAPENDAIRTGIAFCSRGDYKRAVNYFEEMVRKYPDSAKGYEWLGKSYRRLGDYDSVVDPQLLEKAANAFLKALSLDPALSEVRYELGLTYLSIDDKESAVKQYDLLRSTDNKFASQLLEPIMRYKQPHLYRIVHEKGGSVTPVAIIGNQVLVPVILTKDDTQVAATLLLDTGATVTSIHSDLAARLHMNLAQAKKGRGHVAGGGIVEIWRTTATLTVGPHTKTDMDLAVMEHRGPPVLYEGLLGMNFLRNVRYRIDFQNRTINWE